MAKDPDYEKRSKLAADAPDVFDEIKKKIYKKIYGEAERSLKKIASLRDCSAEEDIQFKAAKDLLDRAGFIAPKSVNHTGSVQFTPFNACGDSEESL